MKRVIAVAIILGVGIGWRASLLSGPFWATPHWNEGHYATAAVNVARFGALVQVDDVGLDFTFSPFVPWMAGLSAGVFGRSEAALRLPGFIFGILTLPLVWILAGLLFGRGTHQLWALALAAT